MFDQKGVFVQSIDLLSEFVSVSHSIPITDITWNPLFIVVLKLGDWTGWDLSVAVAGPQGEVAYISQDWESDLT